MIIKLSPQRRDDTLQINKLGEVFTINGVEYDFSVIPDGATLPRDAIDCAFIAGDIERVNGEIIIPIILPLTAHPTTEQAFPVDIINPADGDIQLP